MSAVEAARLSDELGHTMASFGFWAGMVAGALLGAFLVAITGGAALVVIGTIVATAGAGALTGMAYGETCDSDPKGPISTGSPNTFIGTDIQPAGRAGIDKVQCDDHDEKLVAEGSSTVIINMHHAARKTDRTQCSGKIREGWPTVIFGGDAQLVVELEAEVDPRLVQLAQFMMIGGALLAGGAAIVGAVMTGGLLAGAVTTINLAVGFGGSMLGSHVLGNVGERLYGRRGRIIGEFTGGFFGGMGASWASNRAMSAAIASPTLGPRIVAAERAIARPLLRASPTLRNAIARSPGASPTHNVARRMVAAEHLRAYRAAGRPPGDQVARSIGFQNGGRMGPGGYGGTDALVNRPLQVGDYVVIGKGGPPSGYAVPKAQYDAFLRGGGTIDQYYQGIQVNGSTRATPGNPNGYRTEVEIYRITNEIPAAQGQALANPKYGRGGLDQIYADGLRGSNLTNNAVLVRTETLPVPSSPTTFRPNVYDPALGGTQLGTGANPVAGTVGGTDVDGEP